MEIRQLFDFLLSRLWTVAGLFMLVFAIGVLYLLMATPMYEANGLVQVEEKDAGGLNALSEITSLIGGGFAETEAEMEIIKSRMVLGEVIDHMNLSLEVHHRQFPILGSLAVRLRGDELNGPADPILGLKSFAWGGEHIEIGSLEVPEKLYDQKLTLRATSDGFELLGPDGTVLATGAVGAPATGTSSRGPIKIFVRTLVARPGTEFFLKQRRLGDTFSGLRKKLEVVQQGKQSGVIKITFQSDSPKGAAEVINNIENAYLRQNVERRSADARQSLEFLEKQLPEIKGQLDAAQAKLNEYQVKRGSVDVTSETQLLLQQGVELQAQRLQLSQQRDQASQRFTAQHPVMLALNQQIESITKAQEKLQNQTEKLPETQQEVLGLLRDVDADSILYTQVLNSIQGLRVAKAGTIGNVRIVDYALVPTKPAHPRPIVVLALSAVLGLFVGVGFVLAQRAMLRGVDDPAEIERKLGLSIYASVPYAPEQRRAGQAMARHEPGVHLLAQLDSGNPAIEALRSLRTSLHFALLESSNNVVMLTGPSPGLGKSFLSVNFGAVLALSGKRVVVVDCDLRRGRLHRYIGTGAVPGLADYIAGAADEKMIIRQAQIDGLHLIPLGNTPPNPAELLLHERFVGLIQKLSASYDYVLLDTPPILMVTDAAIVGRLAGCTLLVLKSAEHSMRMIEESVRRLVNSGVPVRGILFNQVGARAGSYGYGGYGAGGYGYGNYYRYEGGGGGKD